jgi:UDP-N-acetylmuramoyl-L-alanyl-D-glutamate--2,6-diaminopimelate ligase
MVNSASGVVHTYSVKKNAADIVAKNIHLYADRIDFCVLSVGSLNRGELGIPGMFSVYNALAVISAAILLDFEIDEITSALKIHYRCWLSYRNL